MHDARFNATRHLSCLFLIGTLASLSTITVADGTPSENRGITSAIGTVSEFRTIDGNYNNRIDPSMGQTLTPLIRQAPAAYGDLVQTLAGNDRPSARLISSTMGDLPEPAPVLTGPSDFVWAWGQFPDHDISLSESAHPVEPAPIPVPAGDPWFDPTSNGSVTIPFNRSIHDVTSGTGPDNARQQLNEITAWIDASMVYGSDEIRGAALRRNDGSGKMKMSKGRLLPFNVDGLPNAGGTDASLFLAGDAVCNHQTQYADRKGSAQERLPNSLAALTRLGCQIGWSAWSQVVQPLEDQAGLSISMNACSMSKCASRDDPSACTP